MPRFFVISPKGDYYVPQGDRSSKTGADKMPQGDGFVPHLFCVVPRGDRFVPLGDGFVKTGDNLSPPGDNPEPLIKSSAKNVLIVVHLGAQFKTAVSPNPGFHQIE